MTTWWVIKDGPYYLAETSRHRECQGGFSRIVSEDRRDAIHYLTKAEADAIVLREFQDYELPSVSVVQVH